MNALHQLFVWFNDPANWQGTNGVPHRVLEHLSLWAWAMAIACAIAVPGGLLLGRSRRSGTADHQRRQHRAGDPVVRGARARRDLARPRQHCPVVIALVLLAVPPIFTFTFTGVRQVDPATVESARGMGMTEGRILRSVQVPLALPLILNGIRLSSAAVIATAPLAALVGGGGLGRYIVDGFAIRDFAEVGAGVTLVVGLVLLNELLFVAADADRSRAGPGRGMRTPARDVATNT